MRPEHAWTCAQVSLYQLLMEERYGEAVERGLLWYVNQATPEVVRTSPYEVRPCIEHAWARGSSCVTSGLDMCGPFPLFHQLCLLPLCEDHFTCIP